MGNCCKKSLRTEFETRVNSLSHPNREQYTKLNQPIESCNSSTAAESHPKGFNSDSSSAVQSVASELTPPDPNIQFVQRFNLSQKLNQIQEKMRKLDLAELKKISKEKDDFKMYFDVKTDSENQKFHATYIEAQSDMSPLQYILTTSVILESKEKEISSNYERFHTCFKLHMDGTYYILNYIVYKQIMLFSKKDLLILKAFKELSDGTVVSVAVSVEHPDYPIAPGVERMEVIENYSVFSQVETEGSLVPSTRVQLFNSLYPKISASFTILNGIFSKNYRTYFKNLNEYFEKHKSDTEKLKKKFGECVKAAEEI